MKEWKKPLLKTLEISNTESTWTCGSYPDGGVYEVVINNSDSKTMDAYSVACSGECGGATQLN